MIELHQKLTKQITEIVVELGDNIVKRTKFEFKQVVHESFSGIKHYDWEVRDKKKRFYGREYLGMICGEFPASDGYRLIENGRCFGKGTTESTAKLLFIVKYYLINWLNV